MYNIETVFSDHNREVYIQGWNSDGTLNLYIHGVGNVASVKCATIEKVMYATDDQRECDKDNHGDRNSGNYCAYRGVF